MDADAVSTDADAAIGEASNTVDRGAGSGAEEKADDDLRAELRTPKMQSTGRSDMDEEEAPGRSSGSEASRVDRDSEENELDRWLRHTHDALAEESDRLRQPSERASEMEELEQRLRLIEARTTDLETTVRALWTSHQRETQRAHDRIDLLLATLRLMREQSWRV